MTFPWKRGFLRVPPQVRASLDRISTDLILVAATKKVPLSDVSSGLYAHLGLRIEDGAVVSGEAVIPHPSIGKWSRRNVEGWEIKRTDLPMITKTFVWETPNFGDGATYGWHTHYQDREVYQREIFEARGLPIVTEILNDSGTQTALVKFSVGQLLDRKHATFEGDLLFWLNLLQENTGASDVFPSTATRQDFIGTIALDWEVFPPGTAEQVVASLRQSRGGLAPDIEKEATSRTKLFNKLQPEAFLSGSGSFGSYFGALFADDLVVFENLRYGNALYILYGDWQDVSKRSRLDLLKGTDENYDRIRHDDGWEHRFVEHMRLQLKRRGKRLPKRLL